VTAIYRPLTMSLGAKWLGLPSGEG
jgi:hypothetical protein